MANSTVRPRIVTFLEQQDGFVHVGGIARGAQVSAPSVRKVLAELKAAGRLEVSTIPATAAGDQRRTGWPGYRLIRSAPVPDVWPAAGLSGSELLGEALAGLHRIADAAGIFEQTWQAASVAEVCDMIASWCAARRHAPADDGSLAAAVEESNRRWGGAR